MGGKLFEKKNIFNNYIVISNIVCQRSQRRGFKPN